MRKVTKILLKALSVTILFLIFCPILLTLIVDLPSVQNRLIDYATEYISKKLETKVSIGRIRIGAAGSLRLDEFYVEDYQQDTLLYVGKLKIYLSRIKEGGGLILRNGTIANGRLNIRETPDGVMNIKQVVARLSNKDKEKKGDFALGINDVRIEDFSLVIERKEHREPTYGIDYGDMHLDHMSAFIDDFSLNGSTVSGFVRNFSVIEHCGLMVQNFTGGFLVDKGIIDLRDFEVMLRQSDLRISRLVLRGEDWSDYRDFVNKVRIEGELHKSIVSSNDVAHFAPRLLPWDVLARDIDLTVAGPVANMKVDVRNVNFGQSSSLRGDVLLRGLPNVKRATMKLNLERVITCENDIAHLLFGMTGKTLPDKVLSMTGAAGEIICAGRFDGGLDRFDTDLTLTTQTGNALLSASRRPMEVQDAASKGKGEPRLSTLVAHADLRHMELGRILQLPILGDVSALLEFNGTTSKAGINGRLQGNVDNVDFYNCRYEDIDINGLVSNKSFSGRIGSNSQPFAFALNGIANLNEEQPMYDLRLNVASADLHAMQLNKRDSVSVVGFNSELYAIGKNLDSMNGSLGINNVIYHYNADTLKTNAINLTARNAGNQRSLKFSSDFADATFSGPTSYAEVVRYLMTSMAKYLPGISQDQNMAYVSKGEGGYSALSVNVKNIDPLLDAISDGLQLASGSKLNFTMNPNTNHIALRAESDYLERNKMLVTNMNVNLTNQGDSLAMYVSADDMYAGGVHLPQLAIMGGAKNNRVRLSAGFDNKANSVSGMVSLMAQLTRVEPSNMPRVDVTLYPATINTRDKIWRINSDMISIDTTRIVVNDFRVSSGNQLLALDGVASRSNSDSLTLKLRQFEIEPFMGFAKRLGYNVRGYGDGVASLKSALHGGELTADINIDSLKVNHRSVAPLRVVSLWDFEQRRARMQMDNRRDGSRVVSGYYAPVSNRYYAEGELKNLPLDMIDPILTSVVDNTQGVASAKLELSGEGRMAKLNGKIDVSNMSTTIDFTRVGYTIPKATIDVKDNHLQASNVRVYDAEQNSGLLNMDLSLEHLSNIAYDLRVTPRSMIVLNTTQNDNDLFYGKVYASGVATIKGSKKGANLDITATTERNSQFFMPLSGKSDVSNADFVVFEQPGVQIDSTNYLSRKKMAFERRNRIVPASAGGNMTINIALTAQPNAEVQLVIDPTVGDIIKARGEGSLNICVVPNANIFDMYGDYTITEGSYLFTLQNIINKRFIINSGSTIQWTGDPMDARLNIDAVYKLKASLQPLLASTTLDNVTRAVPVECIINLTERLTSPTVTFDIKVPNVDSEIQNAISNLLNNQQSIATQFMYLLVSGSFYSDSSTSNMGATASATTGFELLSNQLSNWLSSDDYNIILRYRPKSELTSDEIDFGFSKSLVNDRLLVELEGNYLVDNKMAQSSNMSNFMGEAYITWLIDRNGNLKLKGFTQTIDRFDENQGLQETGIGIYYKEDFNNWSDLKRRVKNRFMSRRRRAQLEAERLGTDVENEEESEDATSAQDSLSRQGDEELQPAEKRDSLAGQADSLRMTTQKR